MRKATRPKLVAFLALFSMLVFTAAPLAKVPRAAAEAPGDTDTLIAEASAGRVIQVNMAGDVIWEYSGLNNPWRAKRLPNSNTLIVERDGNRVLEVNLNGNVVWEYTTGLTEPFSASRLDNGNTLIANGWPSQNIIEVDPSGTVVWEMPDMAWPQDAIRLANGNTLIADSGHHRLIEVTPNKTIVWEVPIQYYPSSIQRLDNGNTLVSTISSPNHWTGRVMEINSSGAIVWVIENYPEPNSAVRLANGHTLVADIQTNEVREIDSSNNTYWSKTGLNVPASAERVAPVAYQNRPPVAVAGGPYVSNENGSITLDASASHDPFGDSLQYRWDYTNDGTWDTDWSSSPQTTYAWPDDFTGQANVEVSDGELTATATAEVTVNNLAPQTTILSGVSAGGKYIVTASNSGQLFYMDIVNGIPSSPVLIDQRAGGLYSVGVGDFDNDGVMEVLAADSTHIWYYDKTGPGNSFAPPVSIEPPGKSVPMAITTADFNGDGNMDAAVGYASSDHLTILSGHGNGAFIASSVPIKGDIYGLDTADFNNDTLVDLVASTSGGIANVYISHGDGTFNSPTSVNSGSTSVWGVAAGDFNNDGNADIVIGLNSVKFIPGLGNGTFGKISIFKFSAYGLAKTDMNNDGNLDLLTTDGKSTMSYYTGSGTGSFTLQSSVSFKASGIYGVAATANGPEKLTGVEGSVTNVQGSLTDPGYLDTHTATWDWGDGSPTTSGVVTETHNPPAAAGTVTGSHIYTNEGEYTVTLTVTDNNGGVATDTKPIVIEPNTPTGKYIEVTPIPGVNVTFGYVTGGGSTHATVTTTNPGSQKTGFKFLGQYYDITTTAAYTPPVTICLTYDDAGLTAGKERSLKLFHWDGANWINVTSSLDTVANIICGVSPSLSPFGVATDDDPVITITTPGENATYLLNQAVTADWSATDEGSGIQSATGTTPSGQALDTSTVGDKTFTVTATDEAGNVATKNVIYHVRYTTSGVLEPINADGTSLFKINRTIPVKFRLTNAQNQTAPAAVAHLYVSKISNTVLGLVPEPEIIAPGDSGGIFRYGSADQQYIYNLSTKGMTVGAYQLRIELDDGTSMYVFVSMR